MFHKSKKYDNFMSDCKPVVKKKARFLIFCIKKPSLYEKNMCL